ncbi:hypothetical protein DFJ73DRAFT_550231 [Zopfochytrium polystomum]|nr:hypothetical protein DFJ73DRAFT_550231 [Zopfochytrium polystomum]
MLCLIYRDIGFPSASEEDSLLAGHLRLLSPSAEGSCQSSWKEDAVLAPDDMLLSQAKLLLLPPLPLPFSITREFISSLENRLLQAAGIRNQLLEKCQYLTKEIRMFWEELDTPPAERIDLTLDIHRIGEYVELSDKLREQWRRIKEGEVMKAVDCLKELWNCCHLSRDEREKANREIELNMFSPLTLDLAKEEIKSLEERYAREAPLFRAILERRAFIQNASDPRRLFLPSFRLVEEEKFRRSGVPTLLALEASLREMVLGYEADYSQVFTFEGKRWLDVMVVGMRVALPSF